MDSLNLSQQLGPKSGLASGHQSLNASAIMDTSSQASFEKTSGQMSISANLNGSVVSRRQSVVSGNSPDPNAASTTNLHREEYDDLTPEEKINRRAENYAERGTLARIERRAHRSISKNRKLRDALDEGRRFIGEYHAQVSLDHIALSDIRDKRQQRLRELTEEEARLDSRLDYLFTECHRLTDDNERIVEEAAHRDKELASLYAQYELEKSKFRALQRRIRGDQDSQGVASTGLRKAKEQEHGARKKLLRQLTHIWDMQDSIDELKEDIEAMKGKLAAQSGKGVTSSPEDKGSLEHAMRSEGGDGAGKKNVCDREDCAIMREKLKEVNAYVQQLIRQRNSRRSPDARSENLSTSGRGSRSSSRSSIRGIQRRKSLGATAFIL